MANPRAYSPWQAVLMPPSPSDWLPEGHLAFFISDVMDGLDLSGFYQKYSKDGRGNQPFDPRMLIKVLLYNYATGTFASRKIAARCVEDVATRVLAGGSFPKHRTICDFRILHAKEFEKLFLKIGEIARESGMMKLGSLAIDGTKLEASASKHKAMSYGRMRTEQTRLEEEIRELMARAASEDQKDDAELGPEVSGEELPAELRRREDRLKKIKEAKQRLEERQAAEDRERGRSEGDQRKSPRGGPNFKRDFGIPEDKKQDNFTDPDSRIMKTSGGFEQSYNAQIAVDEQSRLIVATDLTQCAADTNELVPLVDQVKDITGQMPEQVLADAGYKSEENFAALEARGIDGYIALSRERKDDTQPPAAESVATQRMRAKLETKAGKARYSRRKTIVEPVFGWIKQAMRFRQFSLRGKAKVTAEWFLICCAVNLKRMNMIQATA